MVKHLIFAVACLALLTLVATPPALARGSRVIDDNDRVPVSRSVHPLARPEFDQGGSSPSLPMQRMILSLKIPADRREELDKLLSEQQDPTSANFHRWLTPEEFGERFGPDQADVDSVTGWLASHGFTVEEVAKGRTWINFSGTAAGVKQTFHTEIHDYRVNGRIHYANASAPEIPRGLVDLVSGVVTLNSFPRTSMLTRGRQLVPEEILPLYTYGSSHSLAPGDFSTIYNVAPLYSAGIDGSGQTIAIVGRTHPSSTNWSTFRSTFGLSTNAPQVVVNGTDPGDLGANEDGEADLDVEWSGAVARNATIKFVVSKSTNTTDGADLSAQYIVNNNLAPVMSTSFGSCESAMGSSENAFYNNLWAQAAAQGITSFVSSGDAGAAGCNSASDSTGSGTGVSGLASTPYNVAVGGTQFNEGGTSYWNTTNATDGSSALSYIPEKAWNESANISGGSGLWATGGGMSSYYAKPSWQSALGVPSDGKRDVPDVSLSSAGHDGYRVRTQNAWYLFSGTSASSPSFAGLMALVVQKTGQRQGNVNPRFYQLATLQYNSGGAAVFHDTTSGDNSVPGVSGYSCTAGYDRATGLGSVDAYALISNWTGDFAITPSSASLTVLQGGTGTNSITATVSGVYNNAISLSASGLPAGVTAIFSPSSISAPGSGGSTLSLSATSADAVGSYTVTISGSGGGVTHTATFTLIISNTFTLSVSLSGNGSITSNPTGIACTTGNSGVCSYQFDMGSTVTLLPTASSDYSFSGWSGCTGLSGNDCLVTMTADKKAAVTFVLIPPVKNIAGGTYDSLQAAYDIAATTSTIQSRATVLSPLDFLLDKGKTILLEGGYDSSFTSVTGYTTLSGVLTVGSGSLTVQNLIIE